MGTGVFLGYHLTLSILNSKLEYLYCIKKTKLSICPSILISPRAISISPLHVTTLPLLTCQPDHLSGLLLDIKSWEISS